MKLSDLGSLSIAAFAALLFGSLSTPAFGYQEKEGDKQDEPSKEGEEEEEEEEEERWFALVGGDVYTGTGAMLRGATILSKNGVIEEIGYDPYIPEDAETLDVFGMRVYPGLVALNASSRISGGIFSAPDPGEDLDPHGGLDKIGGTHPAPQSHVEIDETSDDGHVGDDHDDREDRGGDDYDDPDGTQAEEEGRSNAVDSFDPFSQYLVLALASGITTAEQSNSAIKLRRRTLEDVLLGEKNLVTIPWGIGNPSSIRSARKKFEATAGYLREYRAWEAAGDKKKKEPKKPKGFDNNAWRVLRGEVLPRFNSQDREDLLGIARFAQEYDFRPVIWGCREGWTVSDELGRAGAYAVLTPRDRAPKDESLVRPGGSSIENAARLHASGVQVAIRPQNSGFDLGGETGRDLMHLPIEAAFGVRGGLSQEAALEAITVIPARILGVDHRVGTLEVGKDLDAIVTDGDLLHYQTFVQYAVVFGKLEYDKQEEVFFAHIRPRPEPEPEEVEAPATEESEEESEPEESEDEGDPEEEDDEESEDDEEGEGDEEEDADEDPEEEEKDGR